MTQPIRAGTPAGVSLGRDAHGIPHIPLAAYCEGVNTCEVSVESTRGIP